MPGAVFVAPAGHHPLETGNTLESYHERCPGGSAEIGGASAVVTVGRNLFVRVEDLEALRKAVAEG